MGSFIYCYLDRHFHLAGSVSSFIWPLMKPRWPEWAQFSVFYFVSAPMTRCDSWSWWWAFILFFSRIPWVQLWCGAHIFWWQCWISSWIYSAPLQPTFTSGQKNFYSVATGSFYSRNCFKKFLALKVNSSVEIK